MHNSLFRDDAMNDEPFSIGHLLAADELQKDNLNGYIFNACGLTLYEQFVLNAFNMKC